MVAKELDQVFGDSDRHFTTEDSSKLKYLEACIKEGLRLYPSVPAIQRTINEDVELDGYQIPTGASINLSFYALHRNEDLYPEAMKFKPERFLLQDADNHRHPYAFVPFSAGPRNCIGQRFALLEEKVVLSSLLRRFRFTYDTAKNGSPKPCSELVLKPTDGRMPLLVSRR